jgi:hypothetical protein
MPLSVLRPKYVSRRANALLKSSILGRSRSSKFFHVIGTLLHQSPTSEVSVAERSVRDLRHMPRFHEPLQYNHDEERLREERRQSSRLSASSTIPEGGECPTEALETAEWFKHITAIEKAPRSSQRSSPRSSKKRQVSFEESVVVVPVPLRSDYSERLRNRLWTSAVEVCDNVGKRLCTHSNRNLHSLYPIQLKQILFLPPYLERNLIEFAAENCDWRCACLEDEMYTCSVTKELIHPAHVETKQYDVVFGTGADI